MAASAPFFLQISTVIWKKKRVAESVLNKQMSLARAHKHERTRTLIISAEFPWENRASLLHQKRTWAPPFDRSWFRVYLL